jgi:predicted enzyme related to lactoylglutathione lyase
MKTGLVILYVRDIEQSKKFYTEVVGLPLDEQQSSPKFVVLAREGSPLALQELSTLPAGQAKDPGGVEIAFDADDVDAAYRRWKSAGAEILSEPENMPFGRYFLAKDPNGHYVSVYKR